jgi:RNA polymerase sigma-70 factor (ECF subfamily)
MANYTKSMSFNEIYNKFHDEVLYYITFKVKKLEVAEEITNNVFLKVNKHLLNFDESKSQFGTWIRNIANNCIIDYFRVDKSIYYTNVGEFVDVETGKEVFQFVADNESDKKIECKELKNKVQLAFDNLKPKYQKIAQLYFMEEMQYNEIAEICDIPMGSVKGMISRCREMLQNQLQSTKVEYSLK